MLPSSLFARPIRYPRQTRGVGWAGAWRSHVFLCLVLNKEKSYKRTSSMYAGDSCRSLSQAHATPVEGSANIGLVRWAYALWCGLRPCHKSPKLPVPGDQISGQEDSPPVLFFITTELKSEVYWCLPYNGGERCQAG